MNIHTIETIRARCTEVGDCWEWGMCFTANGHPTVRHAGKTTLVRRLVHQLAGKEIGHGKIVIASCENSRCVNPDHTRAVTLQAHMKRMGALGKLSDLARIAKIAATTRAKYGKITMDDARAIRESSATHEQTAQQYGINPSKVAAIRQHRCWRELSGNPFAGLGARS